MYLQVADKSPLPILIYSYPGVSGGLEISSDVFATLAAHPNIVGTKQTDHLVGKMARNFWLSKSQGNEFLVFGGGSDYLIGALAVGAVGAITGLANIAPRTVLRLVELWEEGRLEEARELQGRVSAAEWALVAGGVPAFKVRDGTVQVSRYICLILIFAVLRLDRQHVGFSSVEEGFRGGLSHQAPTPCSPKSRLMPRRFMSSRQSCGARQRNALSQV